MAARDALAAQPAAEPLISPGHFAVEVMAGLPAAANRPDHPLRPADLEQALRDAESFDIEIEGTPWGDVHRAFSLAQASLRYTDAEFRGWHGCRPAEKAGDFSAENHPELSLRPPTSAALAASVDSAAVIHA